MPVEKFMKTPRKGTLEHAVFRALGVLDFDSPISHATIHPNVWNAINNNHPDEPGYEYSKKPITRMNHNLLKLPEEVFEEGRKDDLEKIKQAIRSVPEVKTHLQKKPEDKTRLEEVINQAIDLHRIKSPYYWRDSTKQDPAYHKAIYTEAQNMPLEMNHHNARQLAEFAMEKLVQGQEFTIMDTGTGGGNTIRFVLEEIRKRDETKLRRINIVLNDIEDSVNGVASKLKEEFGLKEAVTIPTTFYALPHALEVEGMPAVPDNWTLADKETLARIRGLAGKIDAFTSFASFNNIPHSQLAFDTINALLKKGGKAFIGDWGGYDIAQKNYTQRELRREIPVEGNVTVRQNIKGFWWFWLHHHGYIDLKTGQQKWWDKLEHHIDTAENVNVLDWFNRKHAKMEAERGKRRRKYTFFGFANRAYRTPEMVKAAAKKAGLRVQYIGYPMANKTHTEDGQIEYEPFNPRFVTWHAILEKK